MSTPESATEGTGAPVSPGAETTWFVVPLFNEGEVVGDVIRDLRTRYPLVVCVDDGSRDDSGRIAAEAGAAVVRHPYNMGQGAALKT
ncbi:MAG: glycosyltransferase, partial [Brachybacterium sp.]|nr:glycosyltransferase [Brachybacterium sp.]